MGHFFRYAQWLLAEYSEAVLESGAWAVERVRHEALRRRHGTSVPYDESASAASVCEASLGSGAGGQSPEVEGLQGQWGRRKGAEMEGKRRPMSVMASLRGPEPQAVGGLEVRSRGAGGGRRSAAAFVGHGGRGLRPGKAQASHLLGAAAHKPAGRGGVGGGNQRVLYETDLLSGVCCLWSGGVCSLCVCARARAHAQCLQLRAGTSRVIVARHEAGNHWRESGWPWLAPREGSSLANHEPAGVRQASCSPGKREAGADLVMQVGAGWLLPVEAGCVCTCCADVPCMWLCIHARVSVCTHTGMRWNQGQAPGVSPRASLRRRRARG